MITVKILIVEDDLDSREGLARYIRACWGLPDIPLDIICVETLAEGLNHAASANVTFLDLELPDSTNENTMRHIRDFQPPVIVMTGTSDTDTIASCMEHGADSVFIKGTVIGLMPKLFETLQHDVVRKAQERNSV